MNFEMKLSRHMEIYTSARLKFLSFRQFAEMIPQEVCYYGNDYLYLSILEDGEYKKKEYILKSMFQATLWSWIKEEVKTLYIVEDRSEIDLEFVEEIVVEFMCEFGQSEFYLVNMSKGLWMIANPKNFQIYITEDGVRGALANLKPKLSRMYYLKKRGKNGIDNKKL